VEKGGEQSQWGSFSHPATSNNRGNRDREVVKCAAEKVVEGEGGEKAEDNLTGKSKQGPVNADSREKWKKTKKLQ